MSETTGLTAANLRLQMMEPRGPWQAALVPVQEFPLAEANLLPITLFFQALTQVLRTTYELQHQVALQVWKLGPQTGAALVSANRRAWKPELGLGVWPARTPPSSWTEERMMDAAAAAFRGDEPELPSHRLLRVTQAEPARGETARVMRPFGVLLEVFARRSDVEVLAAAKRSLSAAITDSSFQDQDFYLPLLDQASFAAAASQAQLDEWLCDCDFYVRDSAEDRGILLLSRLPFPALLEQVKGRLRS